MSDLHISRMTAFRRFALGLVGRVFLFSVASFAAIVVLFIFYFIARDAIPFFQLKGFNEFFTSTDWYPSGDPACFGALAIIYGSLIVTAGAMIVAMPLGVAAAICLSDILPFKLRQWVKPVIEMLAAIPSVAYGFFALVIFAPFLQKCGGAALAAGICLVGAPLLFVFSTLVADFAAETFFAKRRFSAKWSVFIFLIVAGCVLLFLAAWNVSGLKISSGTNVLNVSLILGIMALPTIVSVSEDALQSVGRELREGSYALGATRAETILKVVMPAASNGIFSAVILGVMRAVGETMVVWMASGNAAKIPEPFYNILEPVRTLTATIAGDMGEADQVTGSARYHVLFAMALSLLVFSFVMNLVTEFAARRGETRYRQK
ncbi:MAG: phosphate ABC transporter permease subunit PstC [Kiritimatiellaeota bacterium]|nr:phosphate ABC transporter permease subunit PstC [Kiritimatiellota bacterium]